LLVFFIVPEVQFLLFGFALLSAIIPCFASIFNRSSNLPCHCERPARLPSLTCPPHSYGRREL
jgi:hypothetical protein